MNASDDTEFLAHIEVIDPCTRRDRGLFNAVTLEDASTGRMLVAERWQDQESLTANLQGQQAVAFQKWANRIRVDILQNDALNERL
ncbi:antibiotic biosynthesis monooxygenase [Acidisarcina polymorpha]|nr:antibiotic biosynthesis monooxygenase [Acidisarcina polymorpha]